MAKSKGYVAETLADPILLAPEPGPADAQSGRALDSPDPSLSAAVLDVEGEDLLPLDLWRQALPRPATNINNFDVIIPHGNSPLSSSHIAFWTLCFPHLFPYGDGIRAGARRTPFPLRSWARHLLLRTDRPSDFVSWAVDLDFIAVLFSVLHRTELLQAVHAKISTPSFQPFAAPLQALTTQTFVHLQSILGEAGGLCEALRSLAAFFLYCFPPFLFSHSTP